MNNWESVPLQYTGNTKQYNNFVISHESYERHKKLS